MLFKTLDPQEENQFREYAERNDPPDNWRTLCHPVCQEVWIQRGFKDTSEVLDSASSQASELLQAVSEINGTCARIQFQFTTKSQDAIQAAVREFCDRILDKVHLRPGLMYRLYSSPGESCGTATLQCRGELDS